MALGRQDPEQLGQAEATAVMVIILRGQLDGQAVHHWLHLIGRGDAERDGQDVRRHPVRGLAIAAVAARTRIEERRIDRGRQGITRSPQPGRLGHPRRVGAPTRSSSLAVVHSARTR